MVTICGKQKEWDEARRILQEFIQDRKSPDTRTLQYLHNLSEIYLAKSGYDAAEDYFKKGCQRQERILGKCSNLFLGLCYLNGYDIGGEG